jgi:rubrerythrin
MEKPVRTKGIRIQKGESALDAMRDVIPHWIHDIREDPSSVKGFVYLRTCTCSVCGYKASFEKPFCPHCKAVMNKLRGI